MSESNLETYYGLPREVRYCKRCVISNQRPCSYPEFKHTKDRKVGSMHIDEQGICDACRYDEMKKGEIDWAKREEELLVLLDKYRRNDGYYDCLVPGSGGKDSCLAAHVLKYKYGMHPLTVTWPPILYTDYGYENYKNWVEIGGFDNIVVKPSGRVHRMLTRLAIENILHPFQTFILGQKALIPKIAMKYDIPLVFYGESEAEYGNPIAETFSAIRDDYYFALDNPAETYISGVSLPELEEKHGLCRNDLYLYLPASPVELQKSNIQIQYLGYYVKWTPQEAYYFSTEHCGFKARPFRTQGTYSKYNSIDDKIDDLHYYTTHVKFGIGRTTYDASQEIRNLHLTREEGLALAKQFDGERPKRYLQEVLDYIEMSEEEFDTLCDRFRSPHLWKQENGQWKLRHPSWEEEL